jgi:UPF0755 protein
MGRYLWVFLIGAPLLALALTAGQVYYLISVWNYQGPEVIFEVKPGEGFSSINGRLAHQGLIPSAKIFHRYAQVNDLMGKFKAGQYKIESGLTMTQVLETLISGKSITVNVTIPEGKNLFEIASILQKAGVTNKDEFIAKAMDEAFVRKLEIPAERVEGYLYPETYRFTPGSSAEHVIRSMVALFNQKMSDMDFEAAPRGLTRHEVITLASVVEKETGAPEERPIIAGVFHNRLAKKMRLQSDPTTIYGIWDQYNGNLRKQHLLEFTPYNTYKVPALPKGPICNPGREAILAVLSPQQHSYYYFVSQNDGTHIFTATYKEHLEAVNRFQKDPNARKGKSWRDRGRPNQSP